MPSNWGAHCASSRFRCRVHCFQIARNTAGSFGAISTETVLQAAGHMHAADTDSVDIMHRCEQPMQYPLR